MIILFLSIAKYFHWWSSDLHLWSWNCCGSFHADHACVGCFVLLYGWPEGGGKKKNRQCKKKTFIYSWSAMMQMATKFIFVSYWCGIICKIEEQRHHYWPQVVVQWITNSGWGGGGRMQPLTWCYNKKQSPRRWRQKLPGGPLEWSTFGKNSPKHSSNQIDFWLILLFTNISFFG